MTEPENPEAPSLIAVGAQALVDNASRLGITNQVRMGTIVSTDPVTAILDGDSAPVTVIRPSGKMTQGDPASTARIIARIDSGFVGSTGIACVSITRPRGVKT